MRLLKIAASVLGTVAVIAVIPGFVTPKTAHSLVATLVRMAHTLANPVPTVMAGDPNEFVATAGCSFGGAPDNADDSCEIFPLYTVPKNKIAVIDSVSGVCATALGTTIREFQMRYSGPGGAYAQMSFPPSPPEPSVVYSVNVSITGLNATTYAFGGASGTPINFLGLATATQSPTFGGCTLTVSGHYNTGS